MAEEIKRNDVVFDNNRNSYLVTKCIDADTFRVKALADPTVTDIKVLTLSQISEKDKNILRFKGRRYRKIGPYETIQEGAVHIYDGSGSIMPLFSENAIGEKPVQYSSRREFYNPID